MSDGFGHTGQPTIEAVGEVLDRIREAHPSAQQIFWINLRYVLVWERWRELYLTSELGRSRSYT